MLAATAKTKRSLERMQLLLSFASVCAIVDASWIHSPPHDRAGYHAGGPQHSEAREDRLMGDLARTERRRREAELREALELRA